MDDDDDLDLLGAGDEETETGDEGHENADDPDGGEGTGQEDEEGDGGSHDQRAPQGQQRSERVAPSRANNRVQTALKRAEEAERKANEAQTRLDAFLAAQGQRQPDPIALARQQQEEAERVALMSPAEQAQYYVQQSQRQMVGQMAQMQRQTQDQLDRIAFQNLQATNPVAKRFAAEVEKTVAEEARKGSMLPREVALAYVIGKHVLENGGKAAGKQRAAGAARVQAQTTRRGAPQSDLARGNTSNDLSALERRLANQMI